MRSKWLVSLLAFASLGCSPNPDATARQGSSDAESAPAAASRHPVSGLQVIDLSVVSGQKSHPFRVELADTPQAQARGLMFRTELGDGEGMLFPSDIPDVRSFWMKNTPLSLDIIFVGVDGRIINIAANTEPYSLDSVRSEGIASAVLELRAGRAAELGIAPGDKVEYTLP
ncbi:DUF192 domain-containing protein [Altererythrobacter sp. Z27]|uniref:DUF192 domain-containing protein n=1 Tax=Altererythrobacter sp. Z27 TaxID=3461147 RepID=UPI00404487A4